METLNLNQIQERYEMFESHTGIKAIQKAIDKVLSIGKTRREMPDRSVSSRWVNSTFQNQYHELLERRNDIINREFADLKSILDRS
jgi:hypothetical protein